MSRRGDAALMSLLVAVCVPIGLGCALALGTQPVGVMPAPLPSVLVETLVQP